MCVCVCVFRKKPIAYFHPRSIAFCGFEQYKVQPSFSQRKKRNCRSACHGEYLDWNTEISEKVQNCTVEILTGNTFNEPTLLAWVTWHHGNKDKFLRGILIIKPTSCTNFSNLFWNRTLHVSDKFSVHQQESCTVYTAIGICHRGYADCLLASSQHNLYDINLLLCIQYKIPADGQKTCPKHVEFYSKTNLRNQCISLVLL